MSNVARFFFLLSLALASLARADALELPDASYEAATLASCTGQADGAACNDGNTCSVGEICRGGFCLAPVALAQSSASPVATGGTHPFSTAVGDWDGDGRQDLAVVNNVSDNVSILLGNGSGGFVPMGSPITVGTTPSSIVAGDWDGDGDLDLAVTNFGSATLTILKWNAGFAVAGSPIPVGTGPQFITAGNWDGDGDLDLAVADYGSGTVPILQNNGSGVFTVVAAPSLGTGAQPTSVAAGDLDQDGDLDLAVTDYGPSNDVTVLSWNGSTFVPFTTVPVGSNQMFVAITDLDGNGKLDLAVALYNVNAVAIQLGTGGGAFVMGNGSPIAVGLNPFTIAVGDLNGDDRPDLAVANSTSGNVSILLGTGFVGGFRDAAQSPIATGPNPLSVVAGDWNGDSMTDLAVANRVAHNVTVLVNGTTFAAYGTACNDGLVCTLGEVCLGAKCTAPVTFAQPAWSPVGTGVGSAPFSIAAGDFTGDAKLDLAVANSGSQNVAILKWNASSFGLLGSPGVGNTPSSVASGDLDGDGDLDLAVTNFGAGPPGTVTILLGNGAGTFTSGPSYNVGNGPQFVVVADLDADGNRDIVVANYGSNTVTILKGIGGAVFQQATGSPITVGTQPVALAVGQLTPDNVLDLVVANYGSSTLTILKGIGGCQFAPLGPPIAVASPFYVAARNLTADGKIDLAVANYDTNAVTILKGDGLGGFVPVGSPIGVGMNPFAIAVADVNGDSKLDLAVTIATFNQLAILLGNGSGGFGQAVGSPLSTGSNPLSVIAGDWNGDGKPDLAVADRTSNHVMILLNATATDGTQCDDGDICTQTDLCVAWSCTGSDVIGCEADQCHPGGTCIPHVGCPFLTNGTPCDDGSSSTCPDGCQDGSCVGIPKDEPLEVQGVRVQRDGTNAVITWTLAEGATSSAVLRGSLSGFPVGSVGGEETCLAVDLLDTMWTDADVPEQGHGSWYLIRGDCTCREGPLGFRLDHGQQSSRESTTCP